MEETEDPGLFTLVNDIQRLVLGVWSLVKCFLTVSYFTGKYCVEWICFIGTFIWESFCMAAEGVKAVFFAIIELEESLIRAVALMHYGVGQVFEAFVVTFTDLVEFVGRVQISNYQFVATVFEACTSALTVVPKHICSALSIIGDFVLELLIPAFYGVQYVCIKIVYAPVNLILFVSDLGLVIAGLPGKILAAIPFSAHVGSIVILLVYVLYCKLSFFRLVSLLITCATKLYKTVKRVPHFVSQIRKFVPSGNKSVMEEDNRVTDMKGLCVVCHTVEVSYLANPCNHVCLCSGCVRQIVEFDHRCPICRKAVGHYSKVYVS